jgi:hypothetical protein
MPGADVDSLEEWNDDSGRTKQAVLRNQRIFREVNERIAEITAAQNEERAGFLCECGRKDCTESIPLGLTEYKSMRARDGLFLLARGHCLEGVDQVLEAREGYELAVLKAR